MKILIMHPDAGVRTTIALSALRQDHVVMVGPTWPPDWVTWQPDLLILDGSLLNDCRHSESANQRISES